MLKITNLCVSYKKQNVLENLNLQIENSQILGLLGKNGAGKTTLFESIYQTTTYTGDIFLNNKRIKRKDISYLETENYFYPYMTGKEYLSYFSGKSNTKFDDLITRFNLPLDKFVQDYSSGMKKKLALIGMLMLDKPIIILDEPFNGVDFEGVHILYEIIEELKLTNKIVIISSHIIETLFNTCDRIAILENKKIEQFFYREQFKNLKTFKF